MFEAELRLSISADTAEEADRLAVAVADRANHSFGPYASEPVPQAILASASVEAVSERVLV